MSRKKKASSEAPMVREPVAQYVGRVPQTPSEDEKSPSDVPLRNLRAIALLDSWLQGNERSEEEQRETFELLKKALGEDRPSYRKLF